MRVIFRADASIQIGTGHVMRCLTLADALHAEGVHCEFICREHPGNLIECIRRRGYVTHSLEVSNETNFNLTHSQWLGATQRQDAQACIPIVSNFKPDWLIVDHYALDKVWEDMLALYCGRVMAIDDLADREHSCQTLLDQTYGRTGAEYSKLVSKNSTLLCGSRYALLRPEFAALREYSLKRRVYPELKRFLITMGGVDKDNVTGKILAALRHCSLQKKCEFIVVMGDTAPWLSDVRERALLMPWKTTVMVGINNMAQLMADSDFGIGATGSTAWERCVLGLPSVLFMLAENQKYVAEVLQKTNAAFVKAEPKELESWLPNFLELELSNKALTEMSDSASKLVDGLGVSRVAQHLLMDIL